VVKEFRYNNSMTVKNDYDKFLEERNAATLLRDELMFLVGYTANDPDDRVINERLKAALKQHEESRCQDWL
tara:strand:- start:212 stop:424 length:213 start_codon:yes stop_codon:yes gene_type:complete